MVETQLNMFDTVVVTIMGLSMLVSLFRGFIKEFLSLFAWFAAAIVTVYCFDDVAKFVAPHVSSKMVAAGIAGMGTYFSVLIGLSILNRIIIQYVKSGAEVGFLDKVLGIAFGAVRGGFIVSLGYLIMSFFWSEDNKPEWVQTAKTQVYVERGARMIQTMAPGYLEDLKNSTQNAVDSAKGSDSGDSISTDANEMKNDAKDSIKDIRQDLQDTINDSTDDIQDQLNDGAKTIKKSVDDLKKGQ